MAPHVERVCVRGDTDFSLTANFDRWSEYADFIFGYDSQPGMVGRAKALEAGDRERLEHRPRYTSRTGKTRSRREDVKARIVRERGYVNKRLNYEDVAEYDYRPGKCRKTCRMVVVRKNIGKMKGDLTLLGLHGHGGAGVEPQELDRADDAPQGGPPEVRRHGVPALHPR